VQKLDWSATGGRLLVITRTNIRVLDASGRTISAITLTPASPALDASLSPDGQTLALVRAGADQGVTVARLASPRPALRAVLAGFGVRQVLWSPNGRWLLVSWPAADQWVIIAVTGTPRLTAVSRIARQFTGRSRATGFPRLDGWCCTARGAAG
jgi:dipeptidyl aminopeptidase/acylaminoacyl peptidase